MAVTSNTVLSNFDFHAFVGTDSELNDILEFGGGSWKVDVKEYRIINRKSNFALKTLLGQNIETITGSFVRTDTDVWTPESTYVTLRDWAKLTSSDGEKWKDLYVLTPRGGNTYEAAKYNVSIENFDPGQKNSSDGQEFKADFVVSGEAIFGTATIADGKAVFTEDEEA